MAGKVSTSKARTSTGKGKARRSGKGGKTTGSFKAGLIFPVARCARLFRKGRYAERLASSTGPFVAAVLEYLTSEIIELAGNAAQEGKKKTISPRHLQLALRNDDELNKLLAATTIAAGGVVPNVQASLWPKKGKKGGASQE